MPTLPLLNGEPTWNGVPSFLFGMGTTWNYIGKPGFDQNPDIQDQLKAAGVPFIRAFFFQVNETDHKTPVSDASQLRLKDAIKRAGAVGMACLAQPMDVDYALKLVGMLKDVCPSFEVFNEPDLSGSWPPAVSASDYVKWWNDFVPKARALYPGVQFGGPATASPTGNTPDPATGLEYMEAVLKGMAASGVHPDFVTFHKYTAWDEPRDQVLQMAATMGQSGKKAFGWIAKYFPGKSIPLGMTEWNANPGNAGYQYDDAWMSQYTTAVLKSFASSPYLSFAANFDIASYAGYGALDAFRTAYPTSPDKEYTNTPKAIGSPRPHFTAFAAEIAKAKGDVGFEPPAPEPAPEPKPDPVPDPKPEPEPTPDPVPEPDPAPAPEKEPEPAPEPEPGVSTFVCIAAGPDGVLRLGTCTGVFTPAGPAPTSK